ncbi:MAG: hypothetical protein ABIA77_06920 [Candidatus Omnitrophota bacterium]
MKLTRFITIGVIVTITAVGYVHQRVEIIKTAYGVQENRRYLLDLKDRNSGLMYELSKLESPRHLLASFNMGEIEFANHRTRQGNSYRLANTDTGISNVGPGESIIGKVIDLFAPSAEARTRE